MRRIPVYGSMDWERMLEACDGVVRVVEVRLPDGVCGLYDETSGLVLVDSGMRDWQKRCALVHELVHWSYGDRGCSPGVVCREEARARRETACLLVDEAAYASAEALTSGKVFPMACELGVTVQVVLDFQRVLASRR